MASTLLDSPFCMNGHGGILASERVSVEPVAAVTER